MDDPQSLTDAMLMQNVDMSMYDKGRTDSFSLAFDQFTGTGAGFILADMSGADGPMAGSSREFYLQTLSQNRQSTNQQMGESVGQNSQWMDGEKDGGKKGMMNLPDEDKDDDQMFKFQ